MDNDADVGILFPPGRNVLRKKALVNATPASPQKDACLLQSVRVVTTEGLDRIPYQHIPCRNPYPLGGVAAQMLIWEEQDTRALC